MSFLYRVYWLVLKKYEKLYQRIKTATSLWTNLKLNIHTNKHILPSKMLYKFCLPLSSISIIQKNTPNISNNEQTSLNTQHFHCVKLSIPAFHTWPCSRNTIAFFDDYKWKWEQRSQPDTRRRHRLVENSHDGP